jgi:hypothetical protein
MIRASGARQNARYRKIQTSPLSRFLNRALLLIAGWLPP